MDTTTSTYNQTYPFEELCTPGDGSYCPRLSNNTHVYIDNPNDMLDPFHINPAFLTIVVTHAITFFVGIIGNSVVIATWARGGKLRSSTATFLVSLACADLLLLFIYVPLETLEYFVITWDTDGNICKLSSFVEMLSGMATVLNLVAVSVERFLVIVYPIRARHWCTVSKSRRSLLIVWSLAILFAAPIVFNKNMYSITYYNNQTSLTAYYCWEADDHWALFISIYQLMTLFVIPAFLMIICYFCVIRELWASTKVITTLTQPSYNSNGMRIHKDGQSYLVRWPSKRLTSISINCNSSCYSNSSNDYGNNNSVSNHLNGNGVGVNASAVTNNVMVNSSSNNNHSNNNTSRNNNYYSGNSHSNSSHTDSLHNEFDFLHSSYHDTFHAVPTRSPVTDIRNARKQLYFQVIKMLLFIVIIFHICWGPRLIMNVVITLGLTNYDQFTYSARVAFYLLSFIHSALNPFVYGFMSSNFRRMMINSCHSHHSQCHQNGSIVDIAGTSSCVNMSHFNFNAIVHSPVNRRNTGGGGAATAGTGLTTTGATSGLLSSADCYTPSSLSATNATIAVTTTTGPTTAATSEEQCCPLTTDRPGSPSTGHQFRSAVSDGGFQYTTCLSEFTNSSHSF